MTEKTERIRGLFHMLEFLNCSSFLTHHRRHTCFGVEITPSDHYLPYACQKKSLQMSGLFIFHFSQMGSGRVR